MRRSLLLALLPLTMMAACNRTEPGAELAPAATVAAPAIVIEPAVVATIADPVGVSGAPAPGEHTDFDAKAFAGTYADDTMSVDFAADGTYTLSSHAADRSAGTWTLEADGRHVRLDPDSKGEEDRVYALQSDDALAAVGGTQVLRRDAR